MPPFAVLFDMDGLMLDTERLAHRAWTQAMMERGYALEEAAYLRLIGRTAADVQGILSEIFGDAIPYADIYARRRTLYDAEIAANGVAIKPGLLELLDFLEEHQVPKAVASSTHRPIVIMKLSLVGVAGRFPVMVGGDQVTHGKPAPDLFLEAARQLGFSSRHCLVLEDSEAGILAAYRAGMLPVMVPDMKQPDPETARMAYRVVPSLTDVIPLVETFLRAGLPDADSGVE